MSVPTTARGLLLDLAAQCQPAGIEACLAPSGAVLVLAPHPDDETLGCGAAIVATLESGRDVCVVLLTAGGASHPRSRTHPPETLMALRRCEFAAALGRLRDGAGEGGGAGRLTAIEIGLPDSAVPHAAAGLADALDTVDAAARHAGARTVWSTWAGDPHCDHEAAATLGRLLAARLVADGATVVRREYAVWGRFRQDPPAVALHDVTVVETRPGWLDAKRAAMMHYGSQLTPLIGDDPDGFVMPPALVAHFAEHPEIFITPPETSS